MNHPDELCKNKERVELNVMKTKAKAARKQMAEGRCSIENEDLIRQCVYGKFNELYFLNPA